MAQAARPDWIDHAIARLAAAEAEVESLSAQIRSVLTDLTKNATSRVKTLFEMSQHRVEREDLIDHLHAVQEHNRELLADANREVDVQHEIAVELAQLSHSVAALEIGSAITDLSLTGGAIKGDVVGQVNWYRKENFRLNEAYQASEAQLQSTLTSLRHSQAASPSYLPELARLQATSRTASEYLAHLTHQRGLFAADLGSCEEHREEWERRARALVLELVIGWDERRRENGEVGERNGKGSIRMGRSGRVRTMQPGA